MGGYVKLSVYSSVARNLFRRGQNWLRVWGTEDPQGGPGVPRWGFAGIAPEAEDIYANNNCNNVLTKNP